MQTNDYNDTITLVTETDRLNTALIDLIRKKVPEKINVAHWLMDTLFIGREAVYRRLRGEVPFTLAEASVIARKLRLSLNRLIDTDNPQLAQFELNSVYHHDPIGTYGKIIQLYADLFHKFQNEPQSELVTASNIVPQTFYLKYDMIARFRFCKWMYQKDQQSATGCYEDLSFPPDILEKQREFVSRAQSIEQTCYIWDNMIFSHLINDIKYFMMIHLISEENLRKLKEELLELLDEMEEIAVRGAFSTGCPVQIYISKINFEATYSYISTLYSKLSLIRIYSINSITTWDENVYESFKEWIQSLKKFSTLISESGEMQRVRFFKEQRRIVNTL